MGFLKRYFLISRAAFETLERAKHWTAFHVAQHIPGRNPTRSHKSSRTPTRLQRKMDEAKQLLRATESKLKAAIRDNLLERLQKQHEAAAERWPEHANGTEYIESWTTHRRGPQTKLT